MCSSPHIFTVRINSIKRQIRTVSLIINSVKSKINNKFYSKQYLCLISTDISKVYDSVWRHKVLQIPSKIQTDDNIKCFLNTRQFSVTLANA